MQIVIDIPKKLYDRYKEKDYIKKCDIDGFEKALDSCIIIPKGHGRLIDADAYREEFLNSRGFEPMKILGFQPTIIEADKES